ncbi:MAG: hypothetical protein M3Y37_09930 [Chloroflexota bacterium]|jgi:hypothetical protein|nr:hypothetical protein [Chloroflexota bacterium]
MDNALKGMFGGGEEGAAKTDRTRDFMKRFAEGRPDEGYSTEEAATHLDDLLKHANSDQVRRATKNALSNLPEDQQKEFGSFLGDLKARKTGQGGGQLSTDEIADVFGQSGGSANGLDDLFGGLFGGGGGGLGGLLGGDSGGSGGGMGGLLGGLLGGGDEQPRSSGRSSGGGGDFDLGSILGSGVGKMVLGGIAAYLAKEMMDGPG